MKPPRETGVVKFYDPFKKGWGFITRDNGQPDAWVFHRNVVATERSPAGFLLPGDRVEFHVRETPKGPRAKRVVRLVEENRSLLAPGVAPTEVRHGNQES